MKFLPLFLAATGIFATAVNAQSPAGLTRVVPAISPTDRAKEITRLEALPMSTVEANSALNGSTLGDVIESLAVSANMSYIALPDGELRKKPVTFRIFDSAWGALRMLSVSYDFDMLYEQVTPGRAVWRFVPIIPDELVTRSYVLVHNTHEVTSSNQSSSFNSVGGNNGNFQNRNGNNGTNGANGVNGNGSMNNTSFTSDNPLAKQMEEFLATGDSKQVRGFVKWISDTNTFWVTATAKQHQRIEEFLAQVDKPVPQISLDFTFVLASLAPSQSSGVDWSFVDNGLPISLSGLTSNIDLNHGSKTRLPTSAVLSTTDLAAKLNLFSANKNSYSIITGTQTVRSNREATLESVQEIPVLQNQLAPVGGANGTAVAQGTYDYKEVGTIVRAKVKAMEGNKYLIALSISVSSVIDVASNAPGAAPQTAKQSYNTEVVIDDGMSLAMGGLESSVRSETSKKIPGLGDIPFFGFPFKSISKDNVRTRLLLFVTPRRIEGNHGGNFLDKVAVAPVTRKDARKTFEARPGLGLVDVETSLSGVHEEIGALEVAVKGGRGDERVRRQALLIANEFDLMTVTLDENKLKGVEDPDLRTRLKAYRGRVERVIAGANGKGF